MFSIKHSQMFSNTYYWVLFDIWVQCIFYLLSKSLKLTHGLNSALDASATRMNLALTRCGWKVTHYWSKSGFNTLILFVLLIIYARNIIINS